MQRRVFILLVLTVLASTTLAVSYTRPSERVFTINGEPREAKESLPRRSMFGPGGMLGRANRGIENQMLQPSFRQLPQNSPLGVPAHPKAEMDPFAGDKATLTPQGGDDPFGFQHSPSPTPAPILAELNSEHKLDAALANEQESSMKKAWLGRGGNMPSVDTSASFVRKASQARLLSPFNLQESASGTSTDDLTQDFPTLSTSSQPSSSSSPLPSNLLPTNQLPRFTQVQSESAVVSGDTQQTIGAVDDDARPPAPTFTSLPPAGEEPEFNIPAPRRIPVGRTNQDGAPTDMYDNIDRFRQLSSQSSSPVSSPPAGLSGAMPSPFDGPSSSNEDKNTFTHTLGGPHIPQQFQHTTSAPDEAPPAFNPLPPL